MAIQPPQQGSHYTMAPPPNQNQRPHSSMPPPPTPNYQSSLYTLPNQASHVAPKVHAPVPTPAPTDPLEQRILDLIYPYRDECFKDEDEDTVTHERNALILCENIAFLIRHNQTSYGKHIEPNDISIASRNWQVMQQGGGAAGIGVFVNGGNGFSHTVVRTTVSPGEGALDRLTAEVGTQTHIFFPGI